MRRVVALVLAALMTATAAQALPFACVDGAASVAATHACCDGPMATTAPTPCCAMSSPGGQPGTTEARVTAPAIAVTAARTDGARPIERAPDRYTADPPSSASPVPLYLQQHSLLI